ncbi:hypothetical protein FOZ63_026273 [Perkinsus olseni]|uniref:Uncharacterized protein n=1 Tax=Perkinsus olseni TaxID=32597 RepID=A0A7J6S8J0_PEROL|nr:hypothetical protein FOZ63_026273 [Perkinsus olseni]
MPATQFTNGGGRHRPLTGAFRCHFHAFGYNRETGAGVERSRSRQASVPNPPLYQNGRSSSLPPAPRIAAIVLPSPTLDYINDRAARGFGSGEDFATSRARWLCDMFD